jgi:hypothetical protein
MTRRDPTVRIEPKPDYYLIGGPSVGRAPPKRTSLPRHAIGAHHGDMLIRSLTGQEEPYGARVGFAPDTVRVFAPPLPVAALQQLVGESPDLSVPRGYYIVRDWGVYGRYDFAQLPPLPFPMNGSLDWLERAPSHDQAIGNEKEREISKAIVSLRNACNKIELALPQPFTKFMETPSLHDRIRSNTDCFLDLCPAPIPSPVGNGYLIRFLADSQGCIFWYLYLTEDSTDHAVVSTPGFYGTKEEEWQEEKPGPNRNCLQCGVLRGLPLSVLA